jgi:hypothetical protein
MSATIIQAQPEVNPLDNLENHAAAQQQQSPQQQAPAGDPARPAWLPEKFKTPEDLAKSYLELEKKLSQQPKAPAQDTPQQQTPAQQTPAQDQLNKIDLDAIWSEFQKDQKLSDETYAKAEQLGIPRQLIDGFINDAVQTQQNEQREIEERGGGKTQYEAMVKWASTGLTQAEIDAFNKAVETGTIAEALLAVDALKAKYTAANGQNPKNLLLGNGPVSNAVGYRSRAEMVADMANPKYASDPAFRKDVEEKIKNSTIF